MSETPWTPGPWEAAEWERANGGTDWNVWGPQGSNHIGNPDLEGTFGSEADARLIAAAPELAEALENTLRLAEELFEIAPSPRQQDIIDEARAALAKARGETAQ